MRMGASACRINAHLEAGRVSLKPYIQSLQISFTGNGLLPDNFKKKYYLHIIAYTVSASCLLATYLISFLANICSWQLLKDDQNRIMSQSSYVSSSGYVWYNFDFQTFPNICITNHHKYHNGNIAFSHFSQITMHAQLIKSLHKCAITEKTSATNQGTSSIPSLI